jgi:hypothetical protein
MRHRGGTAKADSDRPTSSVALHLETGANARLNRPCWGRNAEWADTPRGEYLGRVPKPYSALAEVYALARGTGTSRTTPQHVVLLTLPSTSRSTGPNKAFGDGDIQDAAIGRRLRGRDDRV